MISLYCPVCLKGGSYENLLIHLYHHGYDDIQANILLNYDKTYKGLIDHFDLKLPEVDQRDERFIFYSKFLCEMYDFFRPLPSEHANLRVEKDIIELVKVYREVLGCKIFKIKEKLKGSGYVTDIDKYEFIVLSEIYKEVVDYQEQLSQPPSGSVLYPRAIKRGSEYLVSWDHIEFKEKKVTVSVHEVDRKSIIDVSSSQELLNYIKEDYFKVRFKGEYFRLNFTDNRKRDLSESTVSDIEDLLRANSKDISKMLKNIRFKGKPLHGTGEIKPTVVDRGDSRFIKNKHEYIQLAVSYCRGNDKVYSIKEHYNGREEGAIIIEYKRSNHTYLLVENENKDRSAHLFAFDKKSMNNVEQVCAYYTSDKENKRGLIKGRLIDFKKDFNTSFDVKTLYHSDIEKYKDYLLEYLNIIG
ncbi:hypothetical protein [Albibacterium profundi]|uniref:C2H2-type domain-containing protein n=1 Tax=Albibacterium profundi TaxID=3134906 RepID=A0ABV5CGM9_9SPHI